VTHEPAGVDPPAYRPAGSARAHRGAAVVPSMALSALAFAAGVGCVVAGLTLAAIAAFAIALAAGAVAALAVWRELDALQRRWDGMIAVSSEWYWEMDAELRFTAFSANVEAITGSRIASVLGRSREQIADAAVRATEAWQRHLADLAARRPFRDFAYVHRRADGELRHFLISGNPIFDRAGRFRGYCGNGRDVTDGRSREAALLRAETRLADAIEGMSDGFLLWDADDRLVVSNSAVARVDPLAAAILTPGVTFEEFLRRRIASGAIADAVGREEEVIRERIAWHRAESGQPIVQRMADGRWIRVVQHRTRDGGVVSIRSDITAIKDHEGELMRAKNQAEAANFAKSQFLATMSHELRTPLNAIIGFSDMLLNEVYGPLGALRYAGYAADIKASGQHLLALITDILDMSRIEAGRYELAPERLPLAELLEESLRMVRGRAEEHGIALAAAIEPGLVAITADRRAVKQILLNLLSNALKFTADGGRVTVSARTAPDAGIAIVVADTGAGIPADRLARIFEPFQHVNASVSQASQGAGLGLSICKRLADLHGLDLAIASALGEGTTVILTFPHARAASAA
jgi:PAS domain S-box-containing protein